MASIQEHTLDLDYFLKGVIGGIMTRIYEIPYITSKNEMKGKMRSAIVITWP